MSNPFSSEQLETFYSAAFAIFQRGEVRKAGDAFFFLSVVKSEDHRFWYGLALCEQLQGKFDKALDAHAMAILTDVEDPYPHFHSALCYRELGQMQEALAALELCLAYAGTKEQFSLLVQDGELMKKQLLSRLF